MQVKTLLEKYRHYEAIITKREDDYVYATIKDVPNAVYQIAGRFNIVELRVTDVKYHSGKNFWFNKKPTRKLVEEIAAWAKADCQFNPENIRIHYTQKFGESTVSGTFKYLELSNYLTKEQAEEKSQTNRAIFEAEEALISSGSHFRCQRCTKVSAKEQMVKGNIIGRSRDRFGKACLTDEPMIFCSGQCAAHEQMSREG